MSPKKKDAIYKKNTLANVLKGQQQDNIARGFYGFQIFLLEYYQAVKKTYKIDYETYMCLFVILNQLIKKRVTLKAGQKINGRIKKK